MLQFFLYNCNQKKEKGLKNFFVFSDASQARLDAFRAFKAGAAREGEIFCALFAHRSLALRAFH
jgi:hypothetical protein